MPDEGSKIHAAVDTLGHLIALHVSPASEQDRARVGELAEAVQEATGESVELAYVDRGSAGEVPAAEAGSRGIRPWSRTPRPRRAPSCCRAGGTSAASRGQRSSGG